MSIIGIVSMKGGVGKTSVTANLATALASKLGKGRVSVIDLDPQNALHWHFGLVEHEQGGLCEQALDQGSLDAIAIPSDYGVTVVPYGIGLEPDREAFEELLDNEPDWLLKQIQATGLDNDAVVLIDTPPGSSVYLKQTLACADLVLIVVLADSGSYATIPSMESYLEEYVEIQPRLGTFYVLNQIDRTEPLNRDVADMLQSHLGERLVPIGIHADQAAGEALAFQQPVMVYDPHGQCSHDLAQLASWVIGVLNQ